MNLKFVHDFETEFRVSKQSCCVMYEYSGLYILLFSHGIKSAHNLAALLIMFLLDHEYKSVFMILELHSRNAIKLAFPSLRFYYIIFNIII